MPGNSDRRVLIPLGLGTALSLLGDSTLYTVLAEPSIAAQFRLSLAAIGLALGVNRLARLAFNGIAGALLDRLPRKPILLSSLALGAVANACYGVATSPGLLLVGRVVWGAAWSGIWVGAHTVILDISDEGSRGRVSGRFQMWFFAGLAATALAGGALTDLVGIRSTLWLATAACVAGLLLWWLLLPETSHDARRPREHPSSESRAFPWTPVLAAGLPYFAIRVTSAGVLASTTILWLESLLKNSAPAKDALFVPLATASGMVVAGRTAAGLAGAPAAGWVSDRLQRRKPIIALALLVGAGGLFLMSTAGLLLALAGLLLIAVSGPAVQALAPAILGDRVPPAQMGRGLGVVFTLGDLGSAIGPPLAFALLAGMPLEAIYLGCSGLMAVTGLLALVPSRVGNRGAVG